jgi:hypothetical protein
MTRMADVEADPSAEFRAGATAVGAAWAGELVRVLRADNRRIVGEWPGTMSEARTRVLAQLRRKLDAGVLNDLAKVAIVAARCEWHQVLQSLRGRS